MKSTILCLSLLSIMMITSGCATLPEEGTWKDRDTPQTYLKTADAGKDKQLAQCEFNWLTLRSGAPTLNNAISLATAAADSTIGPAVAIVTHLLRWNAQKRDAGRYIDACMRKEGLAGEYTF